MRKLLNELYLGTNSRFGFSCETRERLNELLQILENQGYRCEFEWDNLLISPIKRKRDTPFFQGRLRNVGSHQEVEGFFGVSLFHLIIILTISSGLFVSVIITVANNRYENAKGLLIFLFAFVLKLIFDRYIMLKTIRIIKNIVNTSLL